MSQLNYRFTVFFLILNSRWRHSPAKDKQSTQSVQANRIPLAVTMRNLCFYFAEGKIIIIKNRRTTTLDIHIPTSYITDEK